MRNGGWREAWRSAQPTRHHREKIVCYLLSHKQAIKEVILYEAATLMNQLIISDPDLYGLGFLDPIDEIVNELDIA